MELARGIEPPTGGLPINWQGIVQVFEKADNPSSFVHKHWLLFSVFLLHVLSLRGQKFLNIPPKCLHQQVEVIRHQNISMEQLHALARDVHYGRRGRINARELHEQLNSCSCLTRILPCIIYWPAKGISRVLKSCAPEADGIDRAYLPHISPIEWENVILCGPYVITPKLVR